MLTSTIPSKTYKYTMTDQWLDSKGTIWYKAYWEVISPSVAKGYEMGKISDTGNTWEYIYASSDYPIEEW